MKIVIAAGGTAGHIFPALKVAQELKKRGHTIFFAGSFLSGIEQFQHQGFDFISIPSRGFTGRGIQRIFSVMWMLRAIYQSRGLLRNLQPALVLGFGGYGAFPVVLAASWAGLPALIHEQNVIPGRANALLARWVKKIAVSFEQSRAYFGKNKQVILTGCPSHKPPDDPSDLNAEALLQKFGFDKAKKTILVFGGSQGSHRINVTFMETAGMLKGQIAFQVIHICGTKDYLDMKEEYKSSGIPFALFEFFDKIEEAYAMADLVVARAGAVTVTELALFQKSAILIPYPYAGGHQKANAAVLTQTSRAVCIEEKDLSALKLKDEIVRFFSDFNNTHAGKFSMHSPHFPDAVRFLADEAEKLINIRGGAKKEQAVV